MRAVVLAAALIGAATVAHAAGAPAALDTMRKALGAAVQKHDVKGVAAMTSFPLTFTGYEHGNRVTAAQFAKEFDNLFGDGIGQCIATGKIEADAQHSMPNSPWVIDCNGNEYYFGERGGKWMFTAYENINE